MNGLRTHKFQELAVRPEVLEGRTAIFSHTLRPARWDEERTNDSRLHPIRSVASAKPLRGPLNVAKSYVCILLGRTTVTSMRYAVTARGDTAIHFSIPSRCLTRCIDFTELLPFLPDFSSPL